MYVFVLLLVHIQILILSFDTYKYTFAGLFVQSGIAVSIVKSIIWTLLNTPHYTKKKCQRNIEVIDLSFTQIKSDKEFPAVFKLMHMVLDPKQENV